MNYVGKLYGKVNRIYIPLLQTSEDVDALEAGNLPTFQREVHAWSVATFPVQTPESKIAHLLKEVTELAEHPADPSEMADCLILLCGIAELAGVDLLTAARAKMEVNCARSWGEPDELGVQSHIEPTPPTP